MFQLASSSESEYVMNEIFTYLSKGKSGKIVLTRDKFTGRIFVEPKISIPQSIMLEDVVNVLNDLSLSGYVTKTESISTYCVKCFKTGLMLIGRCPNCGSTQLRKGREFVHICGYRGFETMFNSKNGVSLSCPACKRELKEEESDYRSEGLMYRCVSCSRLFGNYHATFECSKCGASYEAGNEPALEVSGFELTEKFWAESLGLFAAYRLRDKLIQRLKEAGYAITSPFYLHARSGDVFLDVLAEQKDRRIGVKLYPLSIPEESILVDRLLSSRSLARLTKEIVILQGNISSNATSKLAKAGIVTLRPDARSVEAINDLVILPETNKLNRSVH